MAPMFVPDVVRTLPRCVFFFYRCLAKFVLAFRACARVRMDVRMRTWNVLEEFGPQALDLTTEIRKKKDGLANLKSGYCISEIWDPFLEFG